MPKAKNNLTGARIDEVAFCRKGMNQHAKVALFKSADAGVETGPPANEAKIMTSSHRGAADAVLTATDGLIDGLIKAGADGTALKKAFADFGATVAAVPQPMAKSGAMSLTEVLNNDAASEDYAVVMDALGQLVPALEDSVTSIIHDAAVTDKAAAVAASVDEFVGLMQAALAADEALPEGIGDGDTADAADAAEAAEAVEKAFPGLIGMHAALIEEVAKDLGSAVATEAGERVAKTLDEFGGEIARAFPELGAVAPFDRFWAGAPAAVLAKALPDKALSFDDLMRQSAFNDNSYRLWDALRTSITSILGDESVSDKLKAVTQSLEEFGDAVLTTVAVAVAGPETAGRDVDSPTPVGKSGPPPWLKDKKPDGATPTQPNTPEDKPGPAAGDPSQDPNAMPPAGPGAASQDVEYLLAVTDPHVAEGWLAILRAMQARIQELEGTSMTPTQQNPAAAAADPAMAKAAAEIVRKSALTPEHKDAVLKALGQHDDPIAKALEGQSAEVRKFVEEQVAKAQADAAEANKLAKAERDRREHLEAVEKAKREFPHLVGTAEQKAGLLKAVEAIADETARAYALQVLKAADGATRAQLGEIGVTALVAKADSTLGQIEAKAADIRKANPSLSEAAAFTKACEANPDLYRQYRQEQRAA